jgi:MoaA/NifB/PqqE/SkfB family radical SAM enzyme
MSNDGQRQLKHFCVMPWIHSMIDSNGDIKVCCRTAPIPKNSAAVFNVLKDSVSDAYNSYFMEQLRHEFLSGGMPTTCEACWNDEAQGASSMRQHENRRHAASIPQIIDGSIKRPYSLELKMGNTCNLKCRICGPWHSSLWEREEADLKNAVPGDSIRAKNSMSRQWPEYEAFWSQDYLSSAVELNLLGGEPFLSKVHWTHLIGLATTDRARSVTIRYNTNATIFPRAEIVDEVWPRFNSVEIALSVDDIGKRFEYERHPAQWSSVEENIKRFMLVTSRHSNIRLQINPTINIHNVYYIPEFIDFFERLQDQIGIRMVSILGSSYVRNSAYDVTRLQDVERATIAAKLMGYLQNRTEFVNESTRRRLVEFISVLHFSSRVSDSDIELVRVISLADAYRGETFSQTFPELCEVISWSDKVERYRKSAVGEVRCLTNSKHDSVQGHSGARRQRDTLEKSNEYD